MENWREIVYAKLLWNNMLTDSSDIDPIKNQSFDLCCESVDWILYDGNIVMNGLTHFWLMFQFYTP